MSENFDVPKLAAIRAVFTAMFDAVDVAGDFDEGRWIDLIAAFNATGRLVFGWPHLESSEGDVFAALDDISMTLVETKDDIERTTADARVILAELRDVIGMGEPDGEPVLDPPLLPEPEPIVRAEVQSVASRSGPPYASDPQTPNEQDELLFAAVRRDPVISMAAAEREAGLAQSRGIQRLKLLDSYGTLPDDIKQWREARSAVRGVPKGVSSLRMHQEARQPAPATISEALSGESFEERRKRMAREATERTWAQRHEGTPA